MRAGSFARRSQATMPLRRHLKVLLRLDGRASYREHLRSAVDTQVSSFRGVLRTIFRRLAEDADECNRHAIALDRERRRLAIRLRRLLLVGHPGIWQAFRDRGINPFVDLIRSSGVGNALSGTDASATALGWAHAAPLPVGGWPGIPTPPDGGLAAPFALRSTLPLALALIPTLTFFPPPGWPPEQEQGQGQGQGRTLPR